jgi:predicted DNA-binding mobile mystery protein A
MNIRTVVRQQYRNIVDSAATSVASLRIPPEGWLRTVRKALGMSGTDVAKKMGVTRARVAQAEHAELTGGVTLKSMRATAEAMGCRFVYAIIPPSGRIEDIVMAQARKKAMTLVGTASKHMALENQALSNDKLAEEAERLTREIAQELPPDFWK